jgi:SPP1 family predicted phage head-tail adaptor
MKCCDITPGMMRHSVTIQALQTTTDPTGGRVATWTDIATVKAKVTPISGSEVYTAMRLDTRITHKVMIRYRSDVSAVNRLIFKGRVLNITAAINIEERDRWLELHCTEGSEI